MNRRQALASVTAIVGAGATLQAFEGKPEEKAAFYVLTLPEHYEDPTDSQLVRMREVVEEVTKGPVLVMPHGFDFRKCTDLKEIEKTSRSWWKSLWSRS